MAEEESIAQIITVSDNQCGYCLEIGGRRADPRILPCRHSFCLPCLQSGYSRLNALRCPICRELVKESMLPDKLPTIDASDALDNEMFCETCESNIENSIKREAEKHCKKCDAAFCGEHIKFHTVLYPSHDTISSEAWKELQTVRESMFCDRHKKYPITTGCKLCHRIFCNTCWSNELHSQCTHNSDSGPHEFDILSNLAVDAKKQVRETMDLIQLKKDELNALEKELSAMIEVIATKKESTLAALNTAREEQVEKLTKAIENINIQYDAMKETFESRMDEIQSQADDYAKEITRLQIQLDRGIAEGKQIHTCQSEADVMRRKAGLMDAARLLSAMAVPIYLNANHALEMTVKANAKADECENELTETPLTYYFKEEGLELQQVAIRVSIPKALKFSHRIANLGFCTSGLQMMRFNNDDALTAVLYHRRNQKWTGWGYDYIHHLSISSANVQQQSGYGSFQYNPSSSVIDLKYKGREIFAMHGDNYRFVLSVIDIGQSGLTNNTSLQRESLPENFKPILSIDVIGEDCVLCSNAETPSLYLWNYKSKEGKQVQITFEEPTKITFVTSGPERSILCLCEEVVVADDRTWYKPDPPTQPQPKKSLALVDADTGTLLWHRYRNPDDNSISKMIRFSWGYYYMCVNTGFEIIDATNGHTATKFMEITGLNDYPQDFEIVVISEGEKKMMIRNTSNYINVVDFIH